MNKEKIIVINFFNKWKEQDPKGYDDFLNLLIKKRLEKKNVKKTIQTY